MAEGVNYDVNAYLRTQGSFGKEMGSAAKAADTFGKSYGSMSDRLVTQGRESLDEKWNVVPVGGASGPSLK